MRTKNHDRKIAPFSALDLILASVAAGLPIPPIAGGAEDATSGDKPVDAKATPTGGERKPTETTPQAEAKTKVEVNNPAPPQAPAVSPEQIERWRQIERENATLREAEDKRQAEARKAEEQRLIEEGKLKEVIAHKDKDLADGAQKLRETETKFKATTRDRELAVELAKHKLTDGSAAQLMKLWKDDLVVVEDGDVFRVQTRDGKPVERFVTENLAHKDYDKFVASTGKGGAPPNKSDNSPAPQTQVDRPSNEQRQVDSLKKSVSSHNYNPLAGAVINRG